MKVLVLGGTGYIGAHLVQALQAQGGFDPVCASRHAGGSGLRLDTRDAFALTQALRGCDAVVNAVAGSAQAIAQGAHALAQAVRSARAAPASRLRAVVHLSSMAVYGDRQGPVNEASPWGHPQGWYARAKQDAERAMADLQDLQVTVLRPGCVWGPGSALWVTRIAHWLAQGRLGDLGEHGDGWTHGVLVDDVCAAILQALQPAGPAAALTAGPRTFNLAAPDSPRWNDWFTDLALALGLTPLRRIRPLQLRADAWVLGPPLQAARVLLARTGMPGMARMLAEPISPGLLRLWASTLRMEATAATRALGIAWTPYPAALHACAASLTAARAKAAGTSCEPPGAAPVR